MPTFTSVSNWDGQKAYVHLSSRLLRWKHSFSLNHLRYLYYDYCADDNHASWLLYASQHTNWHPLLHRTKWRKSSDIDTQKYGNILRKYHLVPLFLPILNRLLSRTLTDTRDKKSQCWSYLKKLSRFKAACKNKFLCNLSFQDCASHFQLGDPREASGGLLCPLIQKFSQICTFLNNSSPRRQFKCFFDWHLNE